MNDESMRRPDEAARRLSDLREGGKKSALPVRESFEPDGEENEEAEGGCFSVLSAARMQKLMVEFRFKDGNAKALAYSYLVAIDFDPSADIVMDFAGSKVKLLGRNLRPLFTALVAQRVAYVQERDDLYAEADTASSATIVTRIDIAQADA